MNPRLLVGINCLVVTDQPAPGSSYSALLEQAGALVTHASSCEHALAVAAQARPDVVVVHLRKPGDALALLLRIRAVAGLSGVPVIGVAPRRTLEAVRYGFDGVLEPPADLDQLLALVVGAARRPSRE